MLLLRSVSFALSLSRYRQKTHTKTRDNWINAILQRRHFYSKWLSRRKNLWIIFGSHEFIFGCENQCLRLLHHLLINFDWIHRFSAIIGQKLNLINVATTWYFMKENRKRGREKENLSWANEARKLSAYHFNNHKF